MEEDQVRLYASRDERERELRELIMTPSAVGSADSLLPSSSSTAATTAAAAASVSHPSTPLLMSGFPTVTPSTPSNPVASVVGSVSGASSTGPTTAEVPVRLQRRLADLARTDLGANDAAAVVPPSSTSQAHQGEVERQQDIEFVVISVISAHGSLGVAIYDGEKVFLADAAGDFESFASLLFVVHEHFSPTIAISSNRTSPELLACIQSKVADEIGLDGEEANQNSSSSSSPNLCLLRPAYFKAAGTKSRLLLNVDLIPSNLSAIERERYLSSLLPLDPPILLCALGGLLAWASGSAAPSGTASRLSSSLKNVQIFSLDGSLRMDRNTIEALSLFPAAAGSKNNGLARQQHHYSSLFSVINHTKSAIGSKMLKEWLLRPSLDRSLLIERQEAIALLLAEPTRLREIQKHVHSAGELSRVVIRLRHGMASVVDWRALIKTLESSISLRLLCRQIDHQQEDTAAPLFSRAAALSDDLTRVLSLITTVIDLKESLLHDRVVVQQGIDSNLDELRQFYAGLSAFFNEVGREEMQALAPSLQAIGQLTVCYYPQIGCQLVLARQEAEAAGAEVLVEAGLEFQFLTETNCYYKNQRMHELDNFLGDIWNDIVDMEAAIVAEVEKRVLLFAPLLNEAWRVCAELDCIAALASVARTHSYVRPQLLLFSADSIAQSYIVQGRHALLERVLSEQFVANDTALAFGREGALHLITGPNSSGKSVYLKQVGLITILAQIGSFVPASAAKLTITDQLFTRIFSPESIGSVSSAFSRDCSQLATAMRSCTPQSLLLIDEFGKGTLPEDGMALLCASLLHLDARGSQAPRALFTTHFHDIHRLSLLSDCTNLSWYHMSLIWRDLNGAVAEDAGAVEEDSFVLLYKLKAGVGIGSSLGLHIAQRAGLSTEVCQRAHEILFNDQAGEEHASRTQKKSRRTAPQQQQQQRGPAISKVAIARETIERRALALFREEVSALNASSVSEFVNRLKRLN